MVPIKGFFFPLEPPIVKGLFWPLRSSFNLVYLVVSCGKTGNCMVTRISSQLRSDSLVIIVVILLAKPTQ